MTEKPPPKKTLLNDVLVDVSICLSGNKRSGCSDVEILILTDRHLTFSLSGSKEAASSARVSQKDPETHQTDRDWEIV